MSNLADIQGKFQQSILNQDDSIIDEIVDTSKEQKAVLLSVYQHAYGARLMEFLENDFPLTFQFVGEDNFAKLAKDYYTAHPSDTANARWFGIKFANFIANHPDYQNNPECAELATLELALNTAFDAKDMTPLDLKALSNIGPDEWPFLTFKPHPSTTRLTHKTNASDVWTALNSEQTPPLIEQIDPNLELIVWRGEGMARFRPMQYDEAMVWDEASKRVPFAGLCEMLGTYWPQDEAPIKAAGYLQAWLNSEFLVAP